MLTIYDICKDIRASGSGKAHKASPSIVEGRQKTKPPAKTGYVQLTPEQILGVHIERLSLNGSIEGYQRGLIVSRSRQIADALLNGKKLAPPTLGLDGGRLFGTDGQHRLVGHVIAWKPCWVIVEAMTAEERAERFADQRLAVRPSADVLALAASDPISDYIKAAIEAEAAGKEHPLAGLVGIKSSATHIGAGTVYEHLAAYVLNTVGGGAVVHTARRLTKAEFRSRFSVDLADEYALLIRAFGSKQMGHPVVFRPATLRSLNDLGVMAIRRSEKKDQDVLRWQRHMPIFDWTSASWATRHAEMRPLLVAHWNKRLPQARKVQF